MTDTPAPVRPVEHGYATLPTPATRFFRTFIPWQLWRFVWINLKMVRIIARSHR